MGQEGDACVAGAEEIAFQKADDLGGTGEVGYWAAECSYVGFVADYRYICTVFVQKIRLQLR